MSNVEEDTSKMDRSTLISHYELKVNEFLADSKNLQQLSNKIYSNELIHLLRDIIRNLHTVSCPMSEDALNEVGIGRASAIWNQSIHFPERHYIRYGRQKPSDQIVIQKGRKKTQPSVRTKTEKLERYVRGLLNKITCSTYKDLATELMNETIWKDNVDLGVVARVIFEKSVQDSFFVKIYADLCSVLHRAEKFVEGEAFERRFHGAILRLCQQKFEAAALSQNPESFAIIENEIKKEKKRKKKKPKIIAALMKQLEEIKAKEKRDMFGATKFISHLFRNGLMSYKVIENCIVILIRNAEQTKSELITEYAVELINYVGPYIAEERAKIYGYVCYIKKNLSPIVSFRMKLMISELVQLVNDIKKSLPYEDSNYIDEDEEGKEDNANDAVDSGASSCTQQNDTLKASESSPTEHPSIMASDSSHPEHPAKDENFDLTEMKKALPMTENRNLFTMDIDELDTIGILRKINSEDQKVAKAVEDELEHIAAGVDIITEAFRNGGRLIYIGAGTSGRLGILDASECPPTYGVQKGMVIGLIAGGRKAIEEPVEGAEDTPDFAVTDLKEIKFSEKDVLTGIAACGKTPYVIGGLEYAKSIGAKTIAIACSKDSPIGKIADVKIEVIVGPEVVTGSTRMKAGTAQKLVLNMLTTSSMIKLGKVYGNLMIDVQAWNLKLVERCKRIWMECTDGNYGEACSSLLETNFNVKEAILMKLAEVNREEAQRRLKASNGHFKTALKME